MLFELFVVGTFWFWALLLVEFILLIYFLENEKYVAAPLSIILLFVLLAMGGPSLGDLIRWIYQHPYHTVGGILGYFVFGTLYVISPFIGKWWWFVRDVRDNNREIKQSWLENWQNRIVSLENEIQRNLERIQREPHAGSVVAFKEQNALMTSEIQALKASNGVMTADLLPYWKEYEKETYFCDWFGRRVSIQKPTPDKFKARITAWIVYWPPSLFWTLLNDPLRRIGRMIYEGVADILKKISDSAWKDEDKLN